MCVAIDVMLSEWSGHHAQIELNELALSSRSTPFHFPNDIHMYVQFLLVVVSKENDFVHGQKKLSLISYF